MTSPLLQMFTYTLTPTQRLGIGPFSSLIAKDSKVANVTRWHSGLQIWKGEVVEQPMI